MGGGRVPCGVTSAEWWTSMGWTAAVREVTLREDAATRKTPVTLSRYL
jgi:hypothetical protein